MSLKTFLLRHVFENISQINTVKGFVESEKEIHFGVSWWLRVERHSSGVRYRVMSGFPRRRDLTATIHGVADFHIQWNEKERTAKKEFVLGANTATRNKDAVAENDFEGGYEERNSGSVMPQKFFELLGDVSVQNDNLEIVCSVNIKKTEGFNVRCFDRFDNSNETDLTIVVDKRKFFVKKQLLIEHSTKMKKEIQSLPKNRPLRVHSVDSDDFQMFLELVYRGKGLHDMTVESVLLIAKHLEAQSIVEKCEAFIQKSKIEMKEKIQLAERYKLEKLKASCEEQAGAKSEQDAVEGISATLGDVRF